MSYLVILQEAKLFVSTFIIGLAVILSSESFTLRLPSSGIFWMGFCQSIFVCFHMLVFVQVLEEEACLVMQRSVFVTCLFISRALSFCLIKRFRNFCLLWFCYLLESFNYDKSKSFSSIGLSFCLTLNKRYSSTYRLIKSNKRGPRGGKKVRSLWFTCY